MAATADPLGAPDHRHRVDRRVVLFRLARQQPAAAATRARRRRGRRRRAVGDPRRRLLPRAEVSRRAGGTAAALHWFKWEAYSTWLSGFALLVVLYWWHADLYIVDRNVSRDHAAAGGRAQRRAARRRLDRLRPACASGSASRTSGCSAVAADRVADRGRVGAVARVQRPRDVHPDRRDARHDDGRERAVRHHPVAAQAGRGEGRAASRPTRSTGCAASSARCTTTTSRCRCC